MTIAIQLLFMSVLAVFIYSGIRDRKKVTDEHSFFYGENLSWLSFALNAFGTNFSFISASFVLVFWSYQYGLSAMLWTVGTGILGILLFSIRWTGPLTRGDLFSENVKTLHHMIGGEDVALRRIAGCVTALTLFGFLIGESYIFAQFFSQYIHWHPGWIIAIVFLVAIVNSWLSGYNAAVKSDYFQVALIGSGCLLLFARLFYAGRQNVLAAATTETFTPLPPFFVPMLILINGLSQFSAMDMWQRAKATAQANEVEKGGVAGSLLFAIVTLALIGCGILLRQEDNKMGNVEADPFVLLNRIAGQSGSPAYTVSVLLFFLSAYLTTMDSIFIALSTTWTMDVLRVSKNLGKVKIHTATVGLVTALVTIGLCAFQFGGQVVNALVVLCSISIILVPTILFKTWLHRLRIKAVVYKTSIVFGFLVGVLAIVWMILAKNSEMANYLPILCFFASWFVILVLSPKNMQNVAGSKN